MQHEIGNVEILLCIDAADLSCRTYCRVMTTVGYCGEVTIRYYGLLIRGSVVRMGYCFVMVRLGAVTVGSCNLVVELRSGSIVGLPCSVLEIVPHWVYTFLLYFAALMFGIRFPWNGLLNKKMEMGFVSWTVESLCRPNSLKQLQEDDKT